MKMKDWNEPKYGLHNLINRCASEKLPIEQIKAFIDENQCDVNLADAAGVTPLHEAAEWGKFEIAKLLVSYGADINAQNQDGFTPLMNTCFVNSIYWIDDGMIETAKVLVESGADIYIKCHHGKTAIDYAKEIYFARGLYYYLLKIPDDRKLYSVLSDDNVGDPITVKPKQSMKYYFDNRGLEEGNCGLITGFLSQITDQLDSIWNSFSNSASSLMLKIAEVDENKIRTGRFYHVHHDDVDVEFLSYQPFDFEDSSLSNSLGYFVEIKPRREFPVSYTIDCYPKELQKDETLIGYFWQTNFDEAYFRMTDGKEVIFYSNEILVEIIDDPKINPPYLEIDSSDIEMKFDFSTMTFRDNYEAKGA